MFEKPPGSESTSAIGDCFEDPTALEAVAVIFGRKEGNIFKYCLVFSLFFCIYGMLMRNSPFF